jgi:hypothetical protein
MKNILLFSLGLFLLGGPKFNPVDTKALCTKKNSKFLKSNALKSRCGLQGNQSFSLHTCISLLLPALDKKI